MLHNLLKGIFSYFKAIELIFSTRLKWFLLIPLVFQLLAVLLGSDLASQFGVELREHVSQWVSQSGWPLFKSATFQYFIVKTSGIIFKFLFFFLFLYFGGYIILMILSPVLAWVSEVAERLVNGRNYPFIWNQFLHDIYRGIKISARNLVMQTVFVLGVILISVIPFLGWAVAPLSPLALFIISAYFYGFSFMDYTCERRQLNVKQSKNFIWHHNGFALANGVVFTLFLAVPFLGIFLAGFMAIISTVAATIGVEEIIQKEGIYGNQGVVE